LKCYQTLSLTQTDTLSQNKRLQIRATNLRVICYEFAEVSQKAFF